MTFLPSAESQGQHRSITNTSTLKYSTIRVYILVSLILETVTPYLHIRTVTPTALAREIMPLYTTLPIANQEATLLDNYS